MALSKLNFLWFLLEGLLRCGKSCRLRWLNYLRPDIRRGNITPDEDDLIIRLHSLLGNRWSLIAGRLPGRTDNEIKNYWNCHLSKRLKNKGNYKQDGDGKTITKAKVYLPKAVRIPFSSPFYADGNNGGEAKLACDHKDSDFVYDNDCHPCQNSEPTTDDMLDKIYKEYQQLLTAENQPSLGSFVDSLFI